MILINFSHPLTQAQQARIEELTDQRIEQTVSVQTQFDERQPFIPQLKELMTRVQLSSSEWQGKPILVVLPSLNFIAAILLAELHGRMGFFPPAVRIRPIAGSIPRQFEVAEILDLQAIREDARLRRLEKSGGV